MKLGGIALGWVTIEESIRRFGRGFEETAEVGAGVGTGALFGLVYRLGLRTTGQSILLGFLVGLGMAGMRKAKESLKSEVGR